MSFLIVVICFISIGIHFCWLRNKKNINDIWQLRALDGFCKGYLALLGLWSVMFFREGLFDLNEKDVFLNNSHLVFIGGLFLVVSYTIARGFGVMVTYNNWAYTIGFGAVTLLLIASAVLYAL